LNCVGCRQHSRSHSLRQILDADQKLRVVKDAVIDREIEAAAIGGEQPVQAGLGSGLQNLLNSAIRASGPRLR
jgi:hypothetical protein